METTEKESEFYPDSYDVWRCCNQRWAHFSELIKHIEHFHFLYTNQIQNRELLHLQQEKPYKYLCPKCNKRTFSFHTTIRHFIDAHVEHLIMCVQCVVMHPEKTFQDHVKECINVERDIQNGR